MNRVLAFVLLTFSAIAFAQAPERRTEPTTGNTHKKLTQNELLAVPNDWNDYSARMFQDSTMVMVFTLTTSWIPGPDHKGMFRYKIGASPKKPPTLHEQLNFPELYGPDAIEKLLKRTHECVISVDLYDADGFILRRIDVPFSYGIDSSTRIVALTANNFTQMDADEYRKLVEKGSWSISWLCDPLSP